MFDKLLDTPSNNAKAVIVISNVFWFIQKTSSRFVNPHILFLRAAMQRIKAALRIIIFWVFINRKKNDGEKEIIYEKSDSHRSRWDLRESRKLHYIQQIQQNIPREMIIWSDWVKYPQLQIFQIASKCTFKWNISLNH